LNFLLITASLPDDEVELSTSTMPGKTGIICHSRSTSLSFEPSELGPSPAHPHVTAQMNITDKKRNGLESIFGA
jgi:hypothetical protein